MYGRTRTTPAASLTILLLTPGPFTPKVKLVLALIGMYSFAIGFLERASTVAKIAAFKGLTSPDVGQYLIANLLFAAFLPLMGSTALARPRSTEDGRVLVAVGRVLWIPISLLLALYSLIHLLIIAPLAYPAWVVASALLAALDASGKGAGIRSSTGGAQIAWVREIVLSDQVRSKAFIVGTPALLLSLVADIVKGLVTATGAA